MNKKLLVSTVIVLLSCIAFAQEKIDSTIMPGAFRMKEYMPLLSGKNIALVTNQSSTVKDRILADTIMSYILSEKLDVTIKKIFSPEHGYTGTYDAGTAIDNEKSPFKSIEVISLYGNKIQPDKEDLAGIDIVLFDLQDVGVRFYTYLSTLHYIMQACAENNISLILLDRPNPNGFYIDGPVMKEKFMSYVGLHPVPIVYGMTIGEYALMLNGERWLGTNLSCNLEVIPIKNYTRKSIYNLPLKPSPNLPNMQSVYLYPSLCFFEGTVMSIGRGTDFPFQVVGHPKYPDRNFKFTPETKPGASVHPLFENKTCYGIDLRNDTIHLNLLNIDLLIEVYHQMGLKDKFFNDYFNLLAGTGLLRKQIIGGLSSDQIRNTWSTEIEEFKKIRAKYLLYPD